MQMFFKFSNIYLIHGLLLLRKFWKSNHCSLKKRRNLLYRILKQRSQNGRPRRLLSQVLLGTVNHETCNVQLPKAIETLIHENVTLIVFFIVCEISFLFVLMRHSIRSKRTCQNVQGLRHQSGNNHRTKNSHVWKKLLKC